MVLMDDLNDKGIPWRKVIEQEIQDMANSGQTCQFLVPIFYYAMQTGLRTVAFGFRDLQPAELM